MKIMGDLERNEVLSRFSVSRETGERLTVLVQELRRWQAIKNLVGPGTLEQVWTRHIADSLQLHACAPDSKRLVDLGSGAGFPGLVLGILLRDVEGAKVYLVESNGRKCAFLRHASRQTGAAAVVREGRIEDVIPTLVSENIQAVTARALAPLTDLLALSKDLLRNGALGIFPKGQSWENELTQASKSWRIKVDALPSKVDERGRIILVRELADEVRHD